MNSKDSRKGSERSEDYKNEILIALAHPERRFILRELRERDDPVHVADLIRDNYSEDEWDDVLQKFYHKHLPMMDESGIIGYDSSENLIEYPGCETMESVLEVIGESMEESGYR